MAVERFLFKNRLVILRVRAPGWPAISVLPIAYEELGGTTIFFSVGLADIMPSIFNPEFSQRQLVLFVHLQRQFLFEIGFLPKQQVQLD